MGQRGKSTEMARLTDNEGRLLGGLNGLRFSKPPTTERAAVAVRTTAKTRLAPKYGPEETVPGLGCGYGTLAYSYTDRLQGRPPQRYACHNPAEAPDERHHCDLCGGDYCTLHAEPSAHDCAFVIETN